MNTSTECHKPQIYLVDDDESMRRALKRLLEAMGFAVEVFVSGKNFLDSVSADARGVLVLDVFMKEMDGYMVQERLIERQSKLKIIFITAHAQPQDRNLAIARGAHGFLLKPFTEKLLLELIQSGSEEVGCV